MGESSRFFANGSRCPKIFYGVYDQAVENISKSGGKSQVIILRADGSPAFTSWTNDGTSYEILKACKATLLGEIVVLK